MNDNKQKDDLKTSVVNQTQNIYIARFIGAVVLSLPASIPMIMLGLGVYWPFDVSVSAVFLSFNYILLKGN